MTGPKLLAPAGAVDTHMHFYGPYDRYPLPSPGAANPPEALVPAYKELQQRLGLDNVVIVQANGYRTDNALVMDCMAELGACARAVVVPALATPEDELAAFAKAGVRGIRYFMLGGGVYRWDDLDALAAMAKPFGWHLQVQLDGRTLPDHIDRLMAVDAPLVIDHTGKFLEPVEIDDPAFKCLLRLVDKGAYVKLSAPYETSKTGAPHFDDVAALAQALIAEAPERMLWASNWPHPGQEKRPDDAVLLDWLGELAPDESTQHLILRDNPGRLYGF